MDVTSAGRASTGVALLAGLGLLAGCGDSAADAGGDDGGSSAAVPTVTVQAGGDEIAVDPTQYCVDGDGQRYATQPPILEVTPDTTIALTVSDAVAEAGWSVQVFDEGLEEILGEVDVPAGEARFDEINSSDVVPPTFYLVVVEDADAEECSGLSGAWPVGFIRTNGQVAPTSPTPAG
jgi:Protein of unknown function (DUF2771)